MMMMMFMSLELDTFIAKDCPKCEWSQCVRCSIWLHEDCNSDNLQYAKCLVPYKTATLMAETLFWYVFILYSIYICVVDRGINMLVRYRVAHEMSYQFSRYRVAHEMSYQYSRYRVAHEMSYQFSRYRVAQEMSYQYSRYRVAHEMS